MKVIAALVACLAVGAVVAGESFADITKLTLSLSESSPYSYISGTTLYYAPTGSNSGSFTVKATTKTDDGTEIDNVEFPSAFGSDSFEDDDSPYTRTYDWTASTSDSGSKTVKATGKADEDKSAAFTVTADTTAPSGQTVALNGGPGFGATSVPLLLGTGTDSGAGVDSSTGVVERASATYANETCGTFGSFAPVTLSGGADASVTGGNCYRYQYKIADNVGNLSTASAASADAKVDTTAPGAPALSFSGLSHTAASGSVVYYRASGPVSLTVTATSIDGESGIGSYGFPGLTGAAVAGSGPSRTYSFPSGESVPAGTFPVSAINGTGIASEAAPFTLTADPTPPTLSIRCNGKPCHGAAYPKRVAVTFSAADTGSGLEAIRYTFDGTAPTSDHGAEYDGPFSVQKLTYVKVRAFDKVGNASKAVNVRIRSLANKFVFAAPGRVNLKVGAKSLSTRVKASHRALASVSMTGPELKKPHRWLFIVAPGTSIVEFRLPKISHPGRYRIVWSVHSEMRKLTKTTTVVLGKR